RAPPPRQASPRSWPSPGTVHICWPSGSTGSSESLHRAGYGSSALPSNRYRERQCEEVLYSSFWNPIQKSGEGIGAAFPKICGATDGGAEAPHGCAVRSGFWKGCPNPFFPEAWIKRNSGIIQTKTPPTANGGGVFRQSTSKSYQAASVICALIFFMAFFSNCRILSAETPYLSANSCNVDLLPVSQRSRRIS